MQYQEAISWLFSQLPMFSRVGAAAYKPGLQLTETLDSIYNHPHRRFKSIHVGGTNGKGSTSHMLASVLQSNGFKTGLYTSPHLVDFRERMRINGEMIPQKEVVKFVEEWKKKNTDLHPSFFELTMMMAFDWFARENVDYAVIEVGMGGRLDSTNVILPILSIITNISFDHTQFLGDTLEKIASEKAGIIKKGIPIIIGEAAGAIKKVFQEKATIEGSPITFADEKFNQDAFHKEENGWKINHENINPLYVPLGGEYQKKNINTVLAAIEKLKEEGIPLRDAEIKEGLEKVCENTGLKGRWQAIRQNPLVICDTGHNHAGITYSMESLKSRFAGRKIKFVIGFVNDKDVAGIVNLFPKDADYYFTQASIPRAMPAEEVMSHFKIAGKEGSVYGDIKEAYEACLKQTSPNDVIYIGGSTFVVADFLKYFEND